MQHNCDVLSVCATVLRPEMAYLVWWDTSKVRTECEYTGVCVFS